jgi:MYXO-CTERM domain-containing protein
VAKKWATGAPARVKVTIPLMRKALVLGSPLLATLALASPAGAATYYVSPTGTCTSACTTRETACDLASGAALAMAGDTVVLMDGVYKKGLFIANAGTAAAPITFIADQCATPIIEGPGVAPDYDGDDAQATGVYSEVGTYLKFDGIVSRGWSSGFGNKWTGNHVQDSNGHWDIQNCIADGNGRTGFTFYSASNFTLKHSISAHNGSSTLHSWSSGITLYASIQSVIEANVSFENMDGEQHTDGSGFIVDESANGNSLINNLAFRNGGSCLRLTRSSGTKFINNTCFHDSQDSQDTGPNNPGEIYFTADTDNSTLTSITFNNNVLVATGTGPGAAALNTQPSSGWTTNVVKTGTVSYFTKAEPDFTLASGATDLVGKGTAGNGAPTNDLGFDPKCLSAGAPTLIGMIAKASWWNFSVNIDYVKSIGGVAKCFNPKMRSGTPDVGAYANGAVTTVMPGACVAPVVGAAMACGGGTAGTGGMSGASAGGASAGGASGAGASAGGTSGAGGSAGGAAPMGGMTSVGGAISAGGVPGTGGAAPAGGNGATMTGAGTGGASATGGAAPKGGTGNPGAGAPPATGGTSTPGAGGTSSGDKEDPSGCGCRVAQDPHGTSFAALGLAGLALFGLRRRRASR